ncbi:hypothetical protein ABZ574_24250 [Streptomyces anulatus]
MLAQTDAPPEVEDLRLADGKVAFGDDHVAEEGAAGGDPGDRRAHATCADEQDAHAGCAFRQRDGP